MIAYKKLATVGADFSSIAFDHFEKQSIHKVKKASPSVDHESLLQFTS